METNRNSVKKNGVLKKATIPFVYYYFGCNDDIDKIENIDIGQKNSLYLIILVILVLMIILTVTIH